ncbi:MAG: hypothetical protein K6C14_00055 [Eubacterium sp.]|nr:hypothetical protein [Eubacterium sp.]
MSSTNKTYHLRLNRWIGSDVPQMSDFNDDNVIIDNAVGTHIANSLIHITDEERNKWNNGYYMFMYYGNGSGNRDITVESGFEPTWGIVFAMNLVASVTDFDNASDYNYFAIVTKSGSMTGASLSGNTLSVQQSAVRVHGDEYKNFNEVGVTYVCIMFA